MMLFSTRISTSNPVNELEDELNLEPLHRLANVNSFSLGFKLH